MSSMNGVGAGLEAARAALPEELVVEACTQLEVAAVLYAEVLTHSNTSLAGAAETGLAQARQALHEAGAALHTVSEHTRQYLGTLGIIGRQAGENPPSGAAEESTVVRQESTDVADSLPTFTELTGGSHRVARTAINPKLIEIARADHGIADIRRAPVPDDQVSWDVEMPDYDPPYIDMPRGHSSLRKVDDGPDPGTPPDGPFVSTVGEPIQLDAAGRRKNPYGRTGMSGRGMLDRWHENPAADLIVTCDNPDTGEMEVVAIQRGDTGEWSALPGGKVDGNETPEQTALREFYEEAGGRGYTAGNIAEDPWDLDMSKAVTIYAGYVDDPRNTDDAWMVTTALHRHLTPEEAARIRPKLQASSDALGVKFVSVDSPFFASHGHLVRRAVELHRQ